MSSLVKLKKRLTYAIGPCVNWQDDSGLGYYPCRSTRYAEIKNPRRLQLPEIILPLPNTRLAVLDGVLRAVVEAGVAVGAMAVPFRATVL